MPIDDFRQKVNKLPAPVKEMMLSDKVVDMSKYKLSLEQEGKIAQITGKALVKDVPLNEFVNALQTQANLNLETAKSITFDILKVLFLPIKRYFPETEILMARLKPAQTPPQDSNIVNLKNK
ncbi:MAG: hypothetical protein ACOZAL_02135 [Patescibacteria group bacterium]